MKPTIILHLSLCIIALLTSCKPDSKNAEILPESYFPLNVGAKSIYLTRWIPSSHTDSIFQISDTSNLVSNPDYPIISQIIEWKVEKDSIVKGKLYYKLVNTGTYNNRLLRNENGVIYNIDIPPTGESFPMSTVEYPILKENANAGDFWTADNFIFTVIEVKKSYTLNGKTYNSVQYIKKEVYTDGKLWLTEYQMYAAGIGLIYSYKPYPLSERYIDVEMKLISVE